MKNFFTIATIIGPALVFGFMGKTVEMGLAIVAGGVAGAFLNLDKFERFSGAGFEAELKKAVEEAYATVNNLKDVAKPLIMISMSNLTYSMRFGGMDFQEKNNHSKELEKISQSLEMQDAELEETFKVFYRYHTWDLYSLFINSVYQETQNHELNKNLNDLKNYSSEAYPTKEIIDSILESYNYSFSEISRKKLDNYIYYQEHREMKYEDLSGEV